MTCFNVLDVDSTHKDFVHRIYANEILQLETNEHTELHEVLLQLHEGESAHKTPEKCDSCSSVLVPRDTYLLSLPSVRVRARETCRCSRWQSRG